VRTFKTGATRDAEDYKFDFEGFLSPLAIERFGEYMHSHRKQVDGNLRDSDNWQKGMPLSCYVKSALRHMFAWWTLHRGYPVVDKKTGEPVSVEDALCGIIFNTQACLHEHLKAKEQPGHGQKATPKRAELYRTGSVKRPRLRPSRRRSRVRVPGPHR
jgi:hypothetical protein